MALLALAVGLVLADSSVVTLALPEILRDFHASVGGVSWVLVAFNLALALAALPGSRLARGRARSAFAASAMAFAAASAVCAAAPSLGVLIAAPSLGVLIAARAAQGVLGAIVVAAALELLVARAGRTRAVGGWAAAGVLGAAVGPAVGGVLTDAFSWQAMFALQAPVALLALGGLRGTAATGAAAAGAVPAATAGAPVAPAAYTLGAPAAATAAAAPPVSAAAAIPATPPVSAAAARPALGPLIALVFVSAALAAALFLLVLMLIEGLRHSPIEAAVTVSALPLAALIAGRAARGHGGPAPAAAGVVLVGGGLAALGLLPGASPAWTIAPQIAIGAGLGVALAALIDATVGGAGRAVASGVENLPRGAPSEGAAAVRGPAAWTIAARHAGIVAGLLILTPIFSADLDRVRLPAERAGVAQLLDAPIPLGAKLGLARQVSDAVNGAGDRLPDLGPAFAAVQVDAQDRPALARLRAGLEDQTDRAGIHAFSRSFEAAAVLALLALVPIGLSAAARRRARNRGASDPPGSNGHVHVHGVAASNGAASPLMIGLPAAATLAALLIAAYVALGGGTFKPTAARDPCAPGERPAVNALGGVQRAALDAIDGAACALHTTREDAVLALLAGKRPAGASNVQLGDALRAGVRRARQVGALSTIEAGALLLALATGGPQAIISLLLDG